MKVSLKWIMEILGVNLDPISTAEKLTMTGTEVEKIEKFNSPHPGIVIADLLHRKPHPFKKEEKDNSLEVLKIWDGKREVEVVCSAPNIPDPGGKVVFAGEGTIVGGKTILPVEFNGIKSMGMLCSEKELEIGEDASGIIVIDENIEAGTPLNSLCDFEDWVLDISVTPNRGDLLGHIGVAREISAIFNIPFNIPSVSENYPAIGEDPSSKIKIEILDTKGCPRYTASVITGVKIKPSPLQIRNRLWRLGLRPISNVVDVTNWCLLLYNQPLHAFDLDLLSGREINVRRAKQGERIITLDGIERILNEDDLVIADRTSPVAIAGIMGGEGSGVNEITKNILIECAYFDPRTIRRTVTRLNLESPSSYRFERDIDPSNQIHVLKDATSLVCKLSGGVAYKNFIDIHPEPKTPAPIKLREARIKKILGVQLNWQESINSLERLGCKLEKNLDFAIVTPPSFRHDLTREIDLIEEIIRLAGYNLLPSTHPRIEVSPPQRGSFDLLESIRKCMSSGGFDEVVNLSIVDSEKQKIFFPNEELILIDNPLSIEKNALRVSLLPGLLENLKLALSLGYRSLRIFEVGTIFKSGDGGIVEGIIEKKAVCAMAFGPRPGWIGEKRGNADFFDVLGILEHLCEEIWNTKPLVEKLKLEENNENYLSFLSPSTACTVSILGEKCGWLGELHPRFHNLTSNMNAGIMEIEIPLKPAIPKRFKGISVFPPVERDISMVFDESVESKRVIETIKKSGEALLESATISDVFRSSEIGKGKKSMTFSLVFRSKERTLKAEEVDNIRNQIISTLEKEFDAHLR